MTTPFIRTDGIAFTLQGRPYRFAGANMWFGAYLGAAGPAGQRDRLCRELDLLASCGITNVRIMASSEHSVLPAAVRPPILRAPDETDEDILCGLDFLMAELARRRMHAVLYLTNFWDWSGGMSSYVAWTDGGAVPAAPGGDGSWAALVDYTSSFYANVSANELYRAQVHRIVTRTNTITGTLYRDDPAIMAWQLANEPRPGLYGAPGEMNTPAFLRWLADTAAFIHSIDPNHLVSTGSEGTAGCLGSEELFATAHRPEQIDYLTFHLWPYNWRWFDPQRERDTIGPAREQSAAYIAQHCALARKLGKPIVLEEFGLTRDGGAVNAGSTTSMRDGFFAFVGGLVLDGMRSGSPLAGSNFWTWAGEGRPDAPHAVAGASDQAPDEPPHEPQGLNSVYDTDSMTLAVIKEHATIIDGLSHAGPGMS